MRKEERQKGGGHNYRLKQTKSWGWGGQKKKRSLGKKQGEVGGHGLGGVRFRSILSKSVRLRSLHFTFEGKKVRLYLHYTTNDLTFLRGWVKVSGKRERTLPYHLGRWGVKGSKKIGGVGGEKGGRRTSGSSYSNCRKERECCLCQSPGKGF